MSDSFGFVLKTKTSDIPGCDAALQKASAYIKDKHPGVLCYSFSHDGNDTLTLVEIYEDTAAWVNKQEDKEFGAVLAGFIALVNIESVEVFGNPSDASKKILDGLGAKYLTHFGNGWVKK